MSNIKHIVFDIGQVLIHWNPEIPFKRLIPDETQRHWFLREVCSPEWNLEQDRGRSWKEAEDALIPQYPEHEVLIKAYWQHWLEMLPFAIEGSVVIMRQLIQAGHDVTMLSNWNQYTYAKAQPVYPFLDLPRGVTVSGEVKLIKPDPAIYHLHAKTFDLEPEGILFFDDSPNNVQAARDVGWMAEVFTSPEQMQVDLVKHGVIPG